MPQNARSAQVESLLRLPQARAETCSDRVSMQVFRLIFGQVRVSLTGRVGLPYQLPKDARTVVVSCIDLGAGNQLLISIASRAGMVSRKGRTAP